MEDRCPKKLYMLHISPPTHHSGCWALDLPFISHILEAIWRQRLSTEPDKGTHNNVVEVRTTYPGLRNIFVRCLVSIPLAVSAATWHRLAGWNSFALTMNRSHLSLNWSLFAASKWQLSRFGIRFQIAGHFWLLLETEIYQLLDWQNHQESSKVQPSSLKIIE